ncbi:MAG: hypothetical protein IPJ11_10870 [Gemmatimonadetes bacterium]|nr:hypothetical protein [Gemmatimonadota bacterium]
MDGSSWERVAIEIDAVQTAPGNREEQVFRILLLAWLTGWSDKRPFALIEGIHTAEHPFVKNFDSAEGIDMGRLISPNVSFGISARSEGLQVADLVASVVYAAASDLSNRGAATYYTLLMKRASYYPAHMGPGLFTPFSDDMTQIAPI